MNHPRPHRSRNNAGFTLVELTIATTLMCTVFVVVGQFLSRWSAARRSAADRTFALLILENTLEQVTVHGGLNGEKIPLPAEITERLRSPQLSLSAGDVDDAGLVPVTGVLSWQNAEGERTTPLTLTAWIRESKSPSGGGP